MGALSIWHVIIAGCGIATLIPAAHALRRVGLSPLWAILAIVPVVGWFAMWAFAYAKWPRDSRPENVF